MMTPALAGRWTTPTGIYTTLIMMEYTTSMYVQCKYVVEIDDIVRTRSD